MKYSNASEYGKPKPNHGDVRDDFCPLEAVSQRCGVAGSVRKGLATEQSGF